MNFLSILKTRVTKSILFLLVFLLAIFSVTKVWNYGRIRPGIDFYQFWVVGQKIVQGDNINVYSGEWQTRVSPEFLQKSRAAIDSSKFRWAAENRRIIEVYSSPFLYSLFGIFSSGNYDRDYKAYQLFCLVCSVSAIIILSRLFLHSIIMSILFVAIFTAWFEPFLADVRVANVNQIQLGLIALFLWFQGRRKLAGRYFLGGLILGFLIAFKPNLIFALLTLSISWLINKRFKKFIFEYAGITVSIAAVLIFTRNSFGSARIWIDWLNAMLSAPANIISLDLGNFSPAMLFLSWFNIDMAIYLSMILSGVTILFIWLGRRLKAADNKQDSNNGFYEDTLMLGIGCLIYLLSARLVWIHYFIFTIPIAIFILRPQIDGYFITARRILGVLAIIAVSVNPVQALFNVRTPHHVAFLIFIGTLALFLLAMAELRPIKKDL